MSPLEMKAERLGFAGLGGGMAAAVTGLGVEWNRVVAVAMLLFLMAAFMMVYAVENR